METGCLCIKKVPLIYLSNIRRLQQESQKLLGKLENHNIEDCYSPEFENHMKDLKNSFKKIMSMLRVKTNVDPNAPNIDF